MCSQMELVTVDFVPYVSIYADYIFFPTVFCFLLFACLLEQKFFP